MVCGDPQTGAPVANNAARRPSGARPAGQPSRWPRKAANRKRWAAIQPVDWSICSARRTKSGAGVGLTNAALAALVKPTPAPDFVRRALQMLQSTGWIAAHRFLFAALRGHLLGWPAGLAPDGRRAALFATGAPV